MPAALSRLSMLDLSRQLPGPYCSMLLADLGMDVLTVCAPTDPLGAGIPMLGRNKRSLTLNLKTAEGQDILHRLVARVDVVLEGGRPGGARKLRADWDTLRAINPRLVYCSISGYGQDGPYRDRVGHDVNYLGFAGVLDVTGLAGQRPSIPGVQIADIGGGALMAVAGILAAVLAREHTGEGQYVDIGMMDGAVAWQVINVTNLFGMGQPQRREQTLLTGYWPCYAIYECQDGRYVTVGALEPHFWRNLCEQLGVPELAALQFSEADRERVFAILRSKFRERPMADWVARLADLDICFGPVATVEEMLDDPQVRHRQMVVDHAGRTTLGNPIKLSMTPPTLRTAPAALGQHTEEVLQGLGFSPHEIAALRARGVV